MFSSTDRPGEPWTVVKTNDKKRGRLEAMRHILARFDYTDRDDGVLGPPDELVIGSASRVFEHGERPEGIPPLA